MPPAERLAAALAGRYRIERELGQGGMATVYLAEDLKHHREVAVKVLNPDLAAALGPERFLREIEVAARLHHPHILPLYDSGEADGFLFYAMPFEKGGSLRDRLERDGPLPVEEVIRLLRDVTEALGYAHQQGLIHRDIKPENVLLSGRHAMVADFGVAKAVDAVGPAQLTTVGAALGTPAYMAPEQAVADPELDHRADLYAVGVLGYELLTGRLPFAGLSAQAMLAAHLHRAPPSLRELRPATPAALERIILRCLEKLPAARFENAEAVVAELETLMTPSGATTPVPAGRWPLRFWRRTGLVAAVGLAAAVTGWLVWSGLRPGPATIVIANVRQVTHQATPELHVAISPDGREVAYESGYPGGTHIVVRDLAGGRSLPLTEDWPDQRGQITPVWMPDGRSVLFTNPWGTPEHAPGIWKIPRLGGQATRPDSADLAALRGGMMLTTRGDTLVARGRGGRETVVFVGAAHSLRWRRDGSAVAFVVGNEAAVFDWGHVAPSEVWVTPMGGAPVRIGDTTSINQSPAWLPDGTLLFISDRDGARDLYAAFLDRSGRLRRPPERLTTGLEAYSLSVSADGTTAAYDRLILRRNVYSLPIPPEGSVSIAEARPLTTGNQRIEALGRSADGRWLVFDSNLGGSQDLYVMATGGGEMRRVTTDPGDEGSPAFAPDGRELAFVSTRRTKRDIFLVGIDGSNHGQLTRGAGDFHNPAFSPDGLRLAFDHDRPDGGGGVEVARRATRDAPWQSPERTPLEGGFAPSWSPDGSMLVCEEGGPPRLMTQGGGALWIYGPGEARRTLFTGGTGNVWVPKWPVWSADGGRIYFRAFESDGTEGVYEIAVTGGMPRRLVRFDDPSRPVFNGAFVVVDGRLYLIVSEFESDVYVMNLVKK